MQLTGVLVVALALAMKDYMAQNTADCGVQKIKAGNLIVRGYNTFPGQYPWHAAIFHQNFRSGIDYACGGSLISRNFVLTAAHCTRSSNGHEISEKRIVVFLGLHNKQIFDCNFQQHLVYKIHTVPREGRWTMLRNDIALLELGSNVQYTDYIQPICLNSLKLSHREVGTVVGWGKTEDDELSQILKTSSVKIIRTIDCLMSNRVLFGGLLDSGMICAGNENGTSVCNGDSGGGLIVKRCYLDTCFWSLMGIVSFAGIGSDGICRPDGYAAFTDVKTYVPWISQVTGFKFEKQARDAVCGQRQHDSPRTKWPWQGRLYWNRSTEFVKNLDVTIITDQFVLTTKFGYKLYKQAPKDITVRFGQPASSLSDQYTQEMRIQAAFARADDLTEDQRSLTLFKLEGHLQFTKYLQPICLWQDESQINDGKRVLQIVPNAHCIAVETKLDQKILCTKRKNGLVLVDSRDSLYLEKENIWFLRGLLMTAIDDNEIILKNRNRTFLDLSYYFNWIIATIQNNTAQNRNI